MLTSTVGDPEDLVVIVIVIARLITLGHFHPSEVIRLSGLDKIGQLKVRVGRLHRINIPHKNAR